MKLISFESEILLDLADKLKVKKYKENVGNANLARFTDKIKLNDQWYMVYSESLHEYFTESEINRITEL
jgi:hypothetical protein